MLQWDDADASCSGFRQQAVVPLSPAQFRHVLMPPVGLLRPVPLSPSVISPSCQSVPFTVPLHRHEQCLLGTDDYSQF